MITITYSQNRKYQLRELDEGAWFKWDDELFILLQHDPPNRSKCLLVDDNEIAFVDGKYEVTPVEIAEIIVRGAKV